MKMVKCKIYFNIERREKLLIPKLNSFECSCMKNDKQHASRGHDTIVVQIANGDKSKKINK
jgi:hypothetical protein